MSIFQAIADEYRPAYPSATRARVYAYLSYHDTFSRLPQERLWGDNGDRSRRADRSGNGIYWASSGAAACPRTDHRCGRAHAEDWRSTTEPAAQLAPGPGPRASRHSYSRHRAGE